jgi:hypothetical protein
VGPFEQALNSASKLRLKGKWVFMVCSFYGHAIGNGDQYLMSA